MRFKLHILINAILNTQYAFLSIYSCYKCGQKKCLCIDNHPHMNINYNNINVIHRQPVIPRQLVVPRQPVIPRQPVVPLPPVIFHQNGVPQQPVVPQQPDIPHRRF